MMIYACFEFRQDLWHIGSVSLTHSMFTEPCNLLSKLSCCPKARITANPAS